MNSKTAIHNTKIRILLFFLRPLYIFNVVLFFKLWDMLSFAPSTFRGYWGRNSAADVTQFLWHDVFARYILWFLLAVLLDIIVQEFFPLIGRE